MRAGYVPLCHNSLCQSSEEYRPLLRIMFSITKGNVNFEIEMSEIKEVIPLTPTLMDTLKYTH